VRHVGEFGAMESIKFHLTFSWVRIWLAFIRSIQTNVKFPRYQI